MVERYLTELWGMLLELSAPLLAGLLLAGLLREFFPARLVRAHLSQPGFLSAVRAALIGVPMPLCSCGVVPAAIALRNQGASRGATTSFLISTPQTGVDSILVSASFLGWPFALFKVVAAFVTGVVGGWLADRVTPPSDGVDADKEQGQDVADKGNRLLAALRYAMFDILAAIDLWLMVGLLLAALITTLLPDGTLQQIEWTQGLSGMLLVLAISLPLYVCTTSSVPIAASLIAAGMPTGTALVFLMAGPATNIATLGVVYRALGGRLLAVYLGTVIVASIGFGMGFDFVLGDPAARSIAMHDHMEPGWWELGSAFVLLCLLCYLAGRRFYTWFKASPSGAEADMTLLVDGMTCPHCAATVKKTLEAIDQVDQAVIDLGGGIVRIQGHRLQRDLLAAAITKAGYAVKE